MTISNSKNNVNLIDVWDKHAEVVNKYNPTKKEVENDPDFIFQKLKNISNKKNKKVLDEGCGIGQYITGARILGFKAEGLDISPTSVKLAKDRGVKVTQGDMRDVPFKEKTFDIVVAGGSIEHFPETEKAIREINRILKKDGLLIGNVPYRYSLFVISKKIQQLLGIWKCGYEKSFSIKKFRKLLEKNGFEVLETKRARMVVGRHKIISGTIKFFDEILWNLGFGGPHFYFFCKKR